MLTSGFESLRIHESKTIEELYGKLCNLSNQALALGEEHFNAKLVRNVIRSLLVRFPNKVITIEKTKDLGRLAINELIDSLQTFEVNINKAKCSRTKGGINIAL
ncbi:hypothetical protein Gorai_006065 [Gossypium raimondii]|uniref:Uncharacterized protein n=1 Tax=Gossypium raimondii TaxID=29730 RepID=A0A0D2REC1_GOSRA|nr:hypothetical protein B456_011G157900 [Gossypium raimondii]MBA0599864.1 hypothetical protein [Gossypium raimondii]